jgi:hypothetical protein
LERDNGLNGGLLQVRASCCALVGGSAWTCLLPLDVPDRPIEMMRIFNDREHGFRSIKLPVHIQFDAYHHL